MHPARSNDSALRLHDRFRRLYGDAVAGHCAKRLAMIIGRYGLGYTQEQPRTRWDQTDAVLITYGDMISNDTDAPLVVLRRFAEQYLTGAINTLHILPFFPYSSDDGFSVIDYRAVNPAYGKWEDVTALNSRFHLMFDLVLNHVSRQSSWFREFTSGTAPFRDYFIQMAPGIDLSAVVRPRSGDLLLETHTRHGPKLVWTTFSPDQIDLNFANPDVLFEFLDILFLYISMGCRILRLDAIAYLWKLPGTPCIHLAETHEIVKIIRDVVEIVAPHVLILTETNVPHPENVSYFGEGDESHMVYQFTLPPLLLHGLLSKDATYLTTWASDLISPPPGCTYLNFTASHDGIGVRPLEGRLPSGELDKVIDAVKARGGLVSTKVNTDGTHSPYELNVTYFDALSDPGPAVTDQHIDRFLLSQAVPLALQGIPAVYINSLFGARNNVDGVAYTGMARTINREKWKQATVDGQLQDDASAASRIFRAYTHLLRLRASLPAFHPDGAQEILRLHPGIFAVVRTSPDETQTVVALHNFTPGLIELDVDERIPQLAGADKWTELIARRQRGRAGRRLALSPYEVCWLLSPRSVAA